MEDKSCSIKERPKTLKEFLKSSYFWKPFLGITLGGLIGFVYYWFIGCSSGSCAITGNPYMSVVFGSFFGLFLVKSPCTNC